MLWLCAAGPQLPQGDTLPSSVEQKLPVGA
ncbi:hypothetical protein J2Z22_004600 [Paenibacillus forsythiae]|uniref:Uncharacterized protein n=1 Tax=Paenibacillus forsythiae TaxID=365616 RepID=A0ABU3HDW5_9BACL|nr:hypothetical protein [Paenibacillus forsythiae]